MKSIASLGVICSIACALGLAAPPTHGAETVRYAFVSDTLKDPGSQVVERSDDGLYTVTFMPRTVTPFPGSRCRRSLRSTSRRA